MASDVDASCENDPNFAVICAFFEKFGENCGLDPIDFTELQSMLENTEEVPPPLADLLIKLMRKVRKTVKPEKWEKSLVSLCHNFSSKDAWEIERFGFKKAKLSSKVRALKELLEMQFDFNVKFKGEINKLTATELRSQPLGRDKSGHAYWFHSDHNFQIRVYKEDLDDETWTLIAKDRESLVSLITKLNDGEVKCSSDSAVNEDSNSLSEKLIIDTGQIDSDSATGKDKSTEDDVEQIPKKMKMEDEEKVLKIHLTDIHKNSKNNDSEKVDEVEKREEVKEEDKPEEHEPKEAKKEDCKKEEETPEAKKAKQEDSEEDEGTSNKSPIVGDTIEEDTMHVKGEGSGKESEAGNVKKATTLDESPIVGEAIEEEVMYIRGEGSGRECETGNDEKASVNETRSGDITQSLNSSSTENSITDDGVVDAHKGENVPKIQLDEVDSAANMSPAKVESEFKPDKRPTFFFGSPQKETSVTTSLTMEFGQKSDQVDKSSSKIVEKETSHKNLEEKLQNCDSFKNESEVNKIKGIGKVDDVNQNKKVLSKNDDSNPKKDEPPDKEDSSKKPEVVEELCVKKSAYVCGEETTEGNKETVTEKQEIKEDDEGSKSSKTESCELEGGKSETPNDEVKSKETTDTTNEEDTKSIATKPDSGKCKAEKNKSGSDVKYDSKTDTNKGKSKDVEGNADCGKSEKESSLSKPDKTECKPDDASTIKNDKSKQPNDSGETDKDKNKSDEISIQEKTNARPGMALRAVRTKRAQSKSTEKPPSEEAPAKDEKIVDTEVVYMKSRRGKKEREVTPPTKTKNVKKPKLWVKNKNKKEDKVDSDNASVTSGSKAGKGSMASAGSSRVSTPVSMPDSIITIPEITDVTSVEEEPPMLEKDPLGCSDDDQDDETVPAPNSQASLQNFSFDYDETAAAPTIPVIPTTRSLRKRGREASPVGHVVDKEQGGKKMKLKGKRRFNTKLRKSIEQQKQQLQQPSSSDEAIAVSSDEAPKPPKEVQSKKKRGRKKKSEAVIEVDDDSSNQAPTTKLKKEKEKKANARLLGSLGIVDPDAVQNEILGVRQSRRLAQIKIKESLDTKKPEPKSKQPVKEEKSKKKSKEIVVPEKKKHGKKPATPEPKVVEPEPSGRRKKKRSVDPSKLFDQSRPWRSSSESSEEEDEAVEEEEEEEVEEKLEFNAKSDHEFSPESDLESGEEYQAPKRARTAKRKDDSAEEEEEEDFPCQKCGKSDHPEWILLCDKCENGWHCSCLRPPLLSIPEGDWFCPPCEHIKLIENLQQKLKDFDKNIVKKNLEDRRKERLAYVGISLNNVLPPTKEQEKREKTKKKRHTSDSGSSESGDEEDDAESETDSDEPVYQLRQRRQARSYKFNEYDDLINSAIQEQLGEPVVRPPSPVCGRGKDMATIVKAEQEERKENDVFKDLAEPNKDAEAGTEDDGEEKKPLVKPPVKKPRKKTRKMTALDVSSEDDDERDEDFIGDVSMSSEDEDVDEEDSDDDSDDIGRRRRNLRPVRRSTRTRANKIDKDFINDDEDDDSDRAPRKKKKKHYFSDEESSESDGSWGRRKKKGGSKKKKSKKKNSILDELSDLEVPNRKKKRRIVYGGLTSSDEDLGRGRRTRGKKTTYVEALGSETEDEVQKRNPRKIESDDEDFVANEEEDEEEAQDEEEPEPDDEEDEEEEENRQKGTEERRRLVVPKIYIKKPAAGVVKETDKNKKMNSEVNKPEEKTDIEQNGKVSEAQKVNEPKEKPADITKTEEKKSIPTTTNNSGRVRIKVVPRKEVPSGKSTNLPEMNKQPEKMSEKDSNKNMEKDLSKITLTTAGKQLDIEKKKPSTVEKVNMKKVISSLDKAGIELTKMPPSEPPTLQKAAAAKPPPPRPIHHEPIVSNVNAFLKNDDSNDELSEPPGVTLPIFDEVTITKKEAPRRRIKIRPKKTLEETVAHLGSAISIKPAVPKPADQSTTTSKCKIEIAAPPQPFSQTAPAPSIITRMLQTPTGTQEVKDTPDKDAVATSAEPAPKPDYSVIGKIRPKQFATMPLEDDDDDEPPAPPPVRQRKLGPTGDSQEHFVQNGGRPGGVPPPSHYHHRLPPTHPPPMNHYPPHQPPPHEPACGPSGAPPPRTHHNVPPPPPPVQGYHKDPPQAYHKEHPPPHVTGSPAKGLEGYSRTQQNRYSAPVSGPAYPLRPPVHMPHPPTYPSPQPPTAAQSEPQAPPQPPPPQYYGNYPPPPVEASEDPPYQNHPAYQEGYGAAEVAPPPSATQEHTAEAEETGGEFGGLVSYFSSQHEDDLDS
ncbi:unnamed protein product [Callosobruchus maculatus]|uniref:Uncharacterized protein n=1 Tax=Callosobruchus maculatus TaxID=64391 RepID=A0A653C2E3_CALMS|nr:unnamed protein product [Callosobruchus maculatus]